MTEPRTVRPALEAQTLMQAGKEADVKLGHSML